MGLSTKLNFKISKKVVDKESIESNLKGLKKIAIKYQVLIKLQILMMNT